MATARKTAAKKAPARTARSVRTAPIIAKPSAMPAAPSPKAAKAAKADKGDKGDKGDKPKKPKLVRDSFTIPKSEYGVLDVLKERAARLGRPAKKSEVLRAGVMALDGMADAAFLACISAVPAIKTGRPAKA